MKKEVFPKHGYPTNKTTSCFRGVEIIGDEVGVTSGTVQTLVIKYFWIKTGGEYVQSGNDETWKPGIV